MNKVYVTLVEYIPNPSTYFYKFSINGLEKYVRITDSDCIAHRSGVSDVAYKYAEEFAQELGVKYAEVIS